MVAYFRFIKQHNVKCTLITSTSRLVSLNQKLSIARLELQASVIATRLKSTIVNEIPNEKRNTILLTDSKMVLNYLHNNGTNFRVQIAHRLNEIR